MKSTRYPPRDLTKPSRFESAKKALHLRRKKKSAKGTADANSIGSSTATAEASPTAMVRSGTAPTSTSATVENGGVLTPVDENTEAAQRRAPGDSDAVTGAAQDLEVGDSHSETTMEAEEVPQLTAGVALGLLTVATLVRLFLNPVHFPDLRAPWGFSRSSPFSLSL